MCSDTLVKNVGNVIQNLAVTIPERIFLFGESFNLNKLPTKSENASKTTLSLQKDIFFSISRLKANLKSREDFKMRCFGSSFFF